MKSAFASTLCLLLFTACSSVKKQPAQLSVYHEPYRLQIHFSPQRGWMNDPNGLVFYKGTYHLFYQYYPDSTVWGPMHWGHATSTDLVDWQHQAIALYPDSLGYIFSGSAVVDSANTSGFGSNGKIPLVAMFTHHDPKGEKEGRTDFQTQGLAYSLDDGKTWTKYAGNPVLKNPGIKDFRDPKVMWHAATKKWILTLATLDHITFYSSPNLKEWTKESEFGKEVGAHGGVWECPDLFPLVYSGRTIWILIVNLNPGGPNGGSATQYFTGGFEGHNFTPFATDTRWLDYGPDEYAGVTWSNTGGRRIFIGWMSNWLYGQHVPTQTWRSAMTVPRDLSVEKVGARYLAVSKPVPELSNLAGSTTTLANIDASHFDLTSKTGKLNGPAEIHFTSDSLQNFALTMSNHLGEQVVIGYDKQNHQYFIDRTKSGNVDFDKSFAGRYTAPRLSANENEDLTLIIDDASVELFADGGLTVMTAIFFPRAPYADITIQSPDHLRLKTMQYTKLRSMYEANATASASK